MEPFIWQVPAGLLGAFLLGLLLGWWLGSRKLHDRLDRLERKWRLKLAGRREELASCRKDLETCREECVRLGEAAAVAPAAATDHDLTRIEGIGPKIQEMLRAAGIDTWAQLADAEEATLRSILDAAGTRFRVHDPATWPQQAALAAEGAWDDLRELQGRLKGGREV